MTDPNVFNPKDTTTIETGDDRDASTMVMDWLWAAKIHHDTAANAWSRVPEDFAQNAQLATSAALIDIARSLQFIAAHMSSHE